MKVIDCDWKKRNGNGQSTCHLCNKLTWDSWCFDFELKILDKELFNTVLCDDCISKIKKELECKMVSNKDTKQEKPKHIAKLNLCKDGDEYMVDIINDLADAVNYLLDKENNER